MNIIYIPIHKALLAKDLNGYSEAAQARKVAFHKQAKKLLTEVASRLEVTGKYRLDTNMAGIAICGETTLHTDHLYIQASDDSSGNGNRLLFRTCKSQKDFSGGPNNYISFSDLADESKQSRFLKQLKMMAEQPTHDQQTQKSPGMRM